jgi:N-acetylmuramoyl-L-alanine amidase
MIEVFSSTILDSIKSAFSKWVVCIDDGHGWLTSGKRSIDGSLRENEFNSSVEDKLTFLLDQGSVEYYCLASGWADEKLHDRSLYENEIAVASKREGKQVIGVSIHADAYPADESAHGFCVYYFKKGNAYSEKGKELSRFIADAIIESDNEHNHIISPRHEYGISSANFHMLRETDGIWCLIENAFMTNDRDLMYLKRDDFRNHRALAILEGLYKYVIQNKDVN